MKGVDIVSIPEQSTLNDLVQMGIQSTHAAVDVRLRKELSLIKNMPVSITIDQVNAFRSMMHDGMMVGAFSHSTAVGKLPSDLPDVPLDAHISFPRYSLDEAEAVCHYYLRQRLVRREAFTEEGWKKFYNLSNGNGAEMRWLAPPNAVMAVTQAYRTKAKVYCRWWGVGRLGCCLVFSKLLMEKSIHRIC